MTYDELIVQRIKLDKFFSMFLDKFERRMNPDEVDTPIWDLYKAKMKEYVKVTKEIQTEEYRMKNKTLYFNTEVKL